MNGIDQILARIDADAQRDADAVQAQAKQEAEKISAQYEARAAALREEILTRGRQAGNEARDRQLRMAALEGRSTLLAAKQEVLSEAFRRALEQLLSLPREEYTQLLVRLCARSSETGREQVVFSPRDRDTVGQDVVAQANELLSREAAKRLTGTEPDTGSTFLDKVVTGASALLAGTGHLTLAEETRPIRGGFILVEEGVELNCSFDTLIRLSRQELEQEAARMLFDPS